MIRVPTEFLNGLSRSLSAIRSSIEFVAAQNRLPHSDIERARETYLGFEQIRLKYMSHVPDIKRTKVDGREVIETLRKDLLDFLNLHGRNGLSNIRSRPLLGPRHNYDGIFHPALFERGIPLDDFIMFLIDSIESVPFEEQFSFDDERKESKFSASAIRKTLPQSQSLAPLQFDIKFNVIVISHHNNEIDEENKFNAATAKNTLLLSGEKIVGELQKSNCDQRLLETIIDLQKNLEADENIIRLGLSNIGVSTMCNAFQQELPDAVFAMIQSHSVGISMYVGQFEDWQKFSEQAAIVEFSQDDVDIIHAAASEIINDIKNSPGIADPEVPRSLAALNQLVSDPRKSTKRAAYAVLRSVENLIIRTFNYGADLLEKSAEKVIEKGSTVIAISIITATLGGAAILSPVGSSIASSAWIQRAVETVQKQLDNL